MWNQTLGTQEAERDSGYHSGEEYRAGRFQEEEEDEFCLGKEEFEEPGRHPNDDTQLAKWFWSLGKPFELNMQI